jgi:superfamily II DNA or RNA helicase
MSKPVKVRLSNRTAVITDCTDSQYAVLQRYWSFSPKGIWFNPKYTPYKNLHGQYSVNLKTLATLKREHSEQVMRIARWEATIAEQKERLATLWDGKIQLLKRNRLSSGLFRATRKEVEETLGIEFEVSYDRESLPLREAIGFSDDPHYRHQNACVQKMLDCTAKGGGIILAATGAGKTAIAAMYFSAVEEQCLFVVDQVDLLYQQQKELAVWLHEDIGVVGDSTYTVKRITVATRQTLSLYMRDAKFRRWYDGIAVIIVDELHEQMGKTNFKVLEAISPLVVFGLTATLQMTQKEVRLKSYAFAGPVIFRFPLDTGIKRGVLNPVKVLQLLFPTIGDPNPTYAAHHLEDILIQVVENEEKQSACQAIVQLLRDYNRCIVILTNRVAQLKTVDELFKKRRGLAYGAIKTRERQKAIQDFESGKIHLLIANKVFKKGVNIKRVDSMIDMAEMYSKNDAAQKLGRVVRLHDDKGMALYIDFGTQEGRYGKFANSRRRALRKLGIPVKSVKVTDAEHALAVVHKFLKREVLDGSERSGNLFEGLHS